MKVFVTLGPGTNHDVVARAYLDFHGASPEALRFVEDPKEGVRMLREAAADYMILCSVHPDAAEITGRNFREIFVVDSFISPSKTLAILTRVDVAAPRRLGIFAPTVDYTDTSAWDEVIVEAEGSIVAVADRLIAGAYDSALVYLHYAEDHAGMFRIDRVIGSPVDAWVVFGRVKAGDGGLVACRDSAVGRDL